MFTSRHHTPRGRLRRALALLVRLAYLTPLTAPSLAFGSAVALGGVSVAATAGIMYGAVLAAMVHQAARRLDRALGLIRLPADDLEAVALEAMVAGECLRAKVPMPELWLTAGSDLDAFSYGLRPPRRLVVSRGLLRAAWTEPEIATAVVAHEVAHLARADVMRAMAALGAGYLAAAGLQLALVPALTPHGPIAVAAGVLLPVLVASLAYLAAQRGHELACDQAAAEAHGTPVMIAALERLAAEEAPRPRPRPALLAAVTATHPPLRDRIASLRRA